MNKNLPWNSSDAWLLQTIMQATIRNSSTDLAGIIAVGDYINHSIFNWDEFENSLAKLIAANYVKVADEKISLTASFQSD